MLPLLIYLYNRRVILKADRTEHTTALCAVEGRGVWSNKVVETGYTSGVQAAMCEKLAKKL